VRVIGSDDQYPLVRNLVLLAGRFMDASDVSLRQKVAMLTEKLAKRLYGGQAAAVGQIIKLHGLQFTVIGTFKEKTDSFGLSELGNETILIPIPVIRYFNQVERIDPMYVQAKTAADVPVVTAMVKQIVESRHRVGAKYSVENLSAILDAAKKIALFAAGVATQKYMQAIQDQQEIMGAIANMTIETYAMESAVLRAQKLAMRNGEAGAANAIAMTRVYMAGALDKIESAARMVIAAVAEGDMLRSQMAILRRLCKYEPFNTVVLRQTIAQRVIETGKYMVT